MIPNQRVSLSGRILAFDFGLRRTGAATGHLPTGHITPLKVFATHDQQQLQALFTDWCPQFCVVGLPLHMNGEMSAMAENAYAFGERLMESFKTPLFFADERMTSRIIRHDQKYTLRHPCSRKSFRQNGKTRNADQSFRCNPYSHTAIIDHYCAAELLRSWFCQYHWS